MWPLLFLSLITSHAISTSRAEHTTTTSFISYHQLKTWSLLSKDNQSKSWEKMWAKKTEIVCHWSLLMLLELAEQSIQLLKCHTSRWRLCHCSQQDNQSKSWKKCGLCFFVIYTSHAFSTSWAEHTTSYMSCKQMKTLSSFTARQPIQISGKDVTSGFLVTGDGV